MKTILVDDEPLSMDFFCMECRSVKEIEIAGRFESPYDALAYAKENEVDLAVLDIEMPGINGIQLGKMLKENNPDIILIYITAHDEYTRDAYNLHAPVYIEKPYNLDDIHYALNTAKLLYRDRQNDIFVRTFGAFEIFHNETPVHFNNKKSKELLAYLVDRRGGVVTNGDAISILWPEAPADIRYQSRLRRVQKDLRDTLRKEGIEDLLICHTNARSLDISKVTCDYYLLLENQKHALASFNYEYMSQYSWGEDTLGALTMHLQKT